MDIYSNSTYYFNKISAIDIKKKKYEILNSNNTWNSKYIVIKTEVFKLDFLIYNNEYYLKANDYYNSEKFNKLFNITLLNWFFKGKIIKLIEFN